MEKIIILLLLVKSVLICIGQPQTVSVKIKEGVDDKFLISRIESNTSQLLSSLNDDYSKRSAVLSIDYRIATPTAIDGMMDIWEDVKFYCPVGQIDENLLTSGEFYQLRNIPIVVDDDIQNVVINFNKDGKIEDFYLGLAMHQYQNVMDPNSVVDRTRREIILNFIENFRTAYVRKDIEFIEKVFSEHALIITGRVVKQQNLSTDNMRSGLSKREIEYMVHTKSEYIDRLRNVFNNISHLILNFNDIEVNVHRKFPNFYGVLLEQHWATAHYQDTGYLFLVIQFRDDDHPLIWIRTWQDASEVERDEIFGFHNFRIDRKSVV